MCDYLKFIVGFSAANFVICPGPCGYYHTVTFIQRVPALHAHPQVNPKLQLVALYSLHKEEGKRLR
jgi:hypothetical protein